MLAPPTPKYHPSHADAGALLPHFVYVQGPRSELNTWKSFHDVIRLQTMRQSARSALVRYQCHHVKPVQNGLILKHRGHISQRKLTDVHILSLVGKCPNSPQLSN